MRRPTVDERGVGRCGSETIELGGPKTTGEVGSEVGGAACDCCDFEIDEPGGPKITGAAADAGGGVGAGAASIGADSVITGPSGGATGGIPSVITGPSGSALGKSGSEGSTKAGNMPGTIGGGVASTGSLSRGPAVATIACSPRAPKNASSFSSNVPAFNSRSIVLCCFYMSARTGASLDSGS
jgi:hypothetical protein